MKKNFNLTRKVDEDFLESFNEIGNVSVIGLTFLISDCDDETRKEVISFNYRNAKELAENKVIVDLSNPDYFNKVKNIL